MDIIFEGAGAESVDDADAGEGGEIGFVDEAGRDRIRRQVRLSTAVIKSSHLDS